MDSVIAEAHRYGRTGPRGVPEHICQCFPDDPIGGPVDEGRELATRALDAQVDDEGGVTQSADELGELLKPVALARHLPVADDCKRDAQVVKGPPRSEERRVGKECRSRWSPDH